MKALWLFPAACVSLLAACSVGKGVGSAKGAIYAYGCLENGGDYCSGDVCPGTADMPAPYDLRPSFFSGEPIDDLREHTPGSEIMSNRLIIRLQTSGKQIEQNDVLTFDVTNSYEVARCVRGRVDNGKNDWNENDCYRASDYGPGRMRVQFDSSVHAALVPRATCPVNLAKAVKSNLVGDAISAPVPPSYTTAASPVVTDGSWSSWVEFEEFGGASQRDKAPSERNPIDGKFRVDFGDRIYATAFFVTLIDDGVVEAARSNLPRPESLIGGTLGGDPTTGRFDFDLQRGQGAQFFP
jgi:hypothetical protein